MRKNNKHRNNYSTNNSSKEKVPPCATYLGNTNPIIKDGKLIYTNDNRFFYFISATSNNSSNNPNFNSISMILDAPPVSNFNLQVSLTTFIIGLFIHGVQKVICDYKKEMKIHSNETVDMFIHSMLQNQPQVTLDFIPSLLLIISNGNAIRSLFNETIFITPLNFYILLLASRMETDPGLFFGNNSYVTPDPINFAAASVYLQFDDLFGWRL